MDRSRRPAFTSLAPEPTRECAQEGELFPDPDDPAAFYHCSDGIVWWKRCPAGLHLDPDLRVCDFPDRIYAAAAKVRYKDQGSLSALSRLVDRIPQRRPSGHPPPNRRAAPGAVAVPLPKVWTTRGPAWPAAPGPGAR
ncbi:carbohydrate-binding module family 14 protein [Nonomuraea antri]|uniref:carbohydrate-binding module family 14 protein n=1 Tax=Nonomuraea antri TaxID=2730852 RepID=UPI0038B322B7